MSSHGLTYRSTTFNPKIYDSKVVAISISMSFYKNNNRIPFRICFPLQEN